MPAGVSILLSVQCVSAEAEFSKYPRKIKREREVDINSRFSWQMLALIIINHLNTQGCTDDTVSPCTHTMWVRGSP